MSGKKESNLFSNTTRKGIYSVGMWSAALSSFTALVAFVIAITTAPARSGPNCPPMVKMGVIDSCVTYPYTNVAAYVPTEYIWMYPAMIISLLFVTLTMAVSLSSSRPLKISGLIAIAFSIIAATIHMINYFIQLAVIQPSLLKSELDSLILFSQYNPHGVFIALEDLGYFLMGIVFFFLSFSLNKGGKLSNTVQYIFRLSAMVIVIGLIGFALYYRSDLEYRYEVLSLTVDWFTLIITGGLLSFYFKRKLKTDTK